MSEHVVAVGRRGGFLLFHVALHRPRHVMAPGAGPVIVSRPIIVILFEQLLQYPVPISVVVRIGSRFHIGGWLGEQVP